jgi:ABC-type phosphate transport system auxiliary subunit
MWTADSPIKQHVICEGGGCSIPANSTAVDLEGVDSAFESSTINQQIQETLQRSQDFIRRYLDAGRQRIDFIKSKLNATLAEQRDTKQFLTKFMMDRETDYALAKESLQNKLKDATTEL